MNDAPAFPRSAKIGVLLILSVSLGSPFFLSSGYSGSIYGIPMPLFLGVILPSILAVACAILFGTPKQAVDQSGPAG